MKSEAAGVGHRDGTMGKNDVIAPLNEVKQGGLSTCMLRRGEKMQRERKGCRKGVWCRCCRAMKFDGQAKVKGISRYVSRLASGVRHSRPLLPDPAELSRAFPEPC